MSASTSSSSSESDSDSAAAFAAAAASAAAAAFAASAFSFFSARFFFALSFFSSASRSLLRSFLVFSFQISFRRRFLLFPRARRIGASCSPAEGKNDGGGVSSTRITGQ